MFQIDEFAAAVLTDFPNAYVYEQEDLIFVQVGLLGLTSELAENIFLAGFRWGLTNTRWSVRLGPHDQLVLTAVFKQKETDFPFRFILVPRERYQQIRQLAEEARDDGSPSAAGELVGLILEHFKDDEE